MGLFLVLPPSSSLDVISRSEANDLLTEIDLDRPEKRKRLYDMAATKGSTANFEIGNYVLWSRVDQRFSKDKLLAQWVGPFAVTEARPYSFSDPSLTIRRYVRGPWLVTPLLRRLLPEHHGGAREFVSNQGVLLGVDGFSDFRYNQALSRWELLVKWTGLQEVEASWESLTELIAQVPDKVRRCAQTVGNGDFVDAVSQQ
ncbi:hypothetical protein L917_18836 [Phytophthora nicotianae]|uniref:Chromo domain-containing protein n=1 Tax=Phytophthora nicotianae TaxID=4792 RepID=W2K681_PHYNI|nr:hypothetical protein L917_18836 [Phytophthora nicotianae]